MIFVQLKKLPKTFQTPSRHPPTNLPDPPNNLLNISNNLSKSTQISSNHVQTISPTISQQYPPNRPQPVQKHIREIKQVVVDVEFAVETLIPYSTALTQSLSGEAQNAAISVGNLFESDLATMSQYGWNFATLDIVFSDPNGASNRKKRQTAGGAIATIKVF